MLATLSLAFALSSQGPLQEDRTQALWKLFQHRHELQTLIDACSVILEVGIEYDPALVSGEVVNARVPGLITAEAIWGLANRALARRGLTSVQAPGSELLSIVPLKEAPQLARVERQAVFGALAGYVKVLVTLEFIKPEEVQAAVQATLSAEGSLTVMRDSGSLMIADYKAYVEQALRAVELLDGAPRGTRVEEVPLQDAAPISLVALLDSIQKAEKAAFGKSMPGTVIAHPERRSVLIIAPATSQVAWKELVRRFDKKETLLTLNYAPRRFGVAETAALVRQVVEGGGQQARIVKDDLTGTLVVTAQMSVHNEVSRLLDRLESTELGPRQQIRSFAVKNRSVHELAELLDGLLEGGILDEVAVPLQETAEEAVRGATAPLRGFPPSSASGSHSELALTITADEGTNRLVAMGEGRVLDQLGRLIETLDVASSQVLVETLIVSLTESQSKTLGVELQTLLTSGDTLYSLSSLFGLGSPDPTSASLPAGGASGFGAVVLDPGDFSAVLRALESLNEGRSLTVPKLLVNNNQEAVLGSVLQTPYTSTNASQTVATTSLGGTLDAGTSITVRPQIADGDQLVLDYSVSLSSFVGSSSDPALPPPRQENRLESVATIPDGYTVVVGGLEIETETDATSKVPVLGSIPMLGSLFQSRSRSKIKSRFFVFIRCSVLRSQTFEDLRYVSGLELDTLDLEDGWPTLEPRVIR